MKWVMPMELSLRKNSKSWKKNSLDGQLISSQIMLVKLLCSPNGSDIKSESLVSLSPKNYSISIMLSPKSTLLKDGKIKWKESPKVQEYLLKIGEESTLFLNYLKHHAVLVDGGDLLHKLDNLFNSEL